MKRNRREARIRSEYHEAQEGQEYQEAQRQSAGGGVIAPNHHPIIDFSENTVYVEMSVDSIEMNLISLRYKFKEVVL